MLFKWKDSYSCNIEVIDTQHKKLFELGNKLYNIATLKDDFDHYDEILNVLDELSNYTVYHFGFEENLMKTNGFEFHDDHKIEHDGFVQKIKSFRNNDIDRNQTKALMDMIGFLANWISAHIVKTDMNYKDYLNSKGVH